MSEVAMLYGSQTEKILYDAIEERIPAIMSYISRDKWHVAKVLLTSLAANRLTAQRAGSGAKPHPINIQLYQPVGVSFKYSHGKFVFDTTVVALEPSPDPACRQQGGSIILAAPDRGEVVQRRSYFRVNVPESLNVKVTLWHRGGEGYPLSRGQACPCGSRETRDERRNYYQGKLVDISAGGAQVMVPYQDDSGQDLVGAEIPDFKKGQFIGLRFTPMPYEMPLIINAQIRHMLPSEDKTSMYLGLQMVGLEASLEGHQVISRIAEIVERYHQMNLSGAKELEVQSGALNRKRSTRIKELPLLCL